MSDPLNIAVPAELVEAIAERVAELLHQHELQNREAGSPWLDFEASCAYLAFSPDALYKLSAAHAIPCRKKAGGQGLRFHRDELDAWMKAQYPRVDRGH